jgi:hypothetical protein
MFLLNTPTQAPLGPPTTTDSRNPTPAGSVPLGSLRSPSLHLTLRGEEQSESILQKGSYTGDPGSNIRYRLLVNGTKVSTDPDWFEEQVRSYRCEPSSGNDFNLVTTMKYRPQCVVVTQNIAHAVNVHPAEMFWSGPRLPSNCGELLSSNFTTSRSVTIGRGSYTEVEVPGYNYKIDYSVISYQ